MHESPALPDVAAASDVLSGHLWLREFVDGARFRFQVRDAAPIRFGDAQRPFDPEDAPPRLRNAVHEVQRTLDRGALRAAVDDVEAVTFVGVATIRRRVDYDWPRLPGFLGTDVYDAARGEWLPVDRATQVFESLSLTPVNALAKEVRATDFDPGDYAFPASAWRDGPAAGVVVRNKPGGRALLANDDALADAPPDVPDDTSPEGLADTYATDARFERAARAVEAAHGAVTFDALQERVLDGIYREHAPAFERMTVDQDAFRRAVAARTSEYLG